MKNFITLTAISLVFCSLMSCAKKSDCEEYSYGKLKVHNATDKTIAVVIPSRAVSQDTKGNVKSGFALTGENVPAGNVKVKISFDGGYTWEYPKVTLKACEDGVYEVK